MNLDKKSKQLAFLLRHDKDGYEDGKITQSGWREVFELCRDHNYSLPELEEIVRKDSKGRYEFNLAHNMIRARQGHSIPVEIDSIKEADPPEFLYHGTSDRFLESIKQKGLIPGTRLYVHLSADLETAKKVGLRHGGNLVILKIRAADMKKDGIVFRISGNGVWLVPEVNPGYLEIIEYETN